MNRLRLVRHGWLLRLVLAALLCLPLLGALHQVVHAPVRSAVQSPDSSPEGGSPAQSGKNGQGGKYDKYGRGDKSDFAWLFAGHGSDADCRVFDQLAHGPSLPNLLAWALPAVAPAALETLGVQTWASHAPAWVRARGPPELA